MSTVILWLTVTAAALAMRPLLPVDETRYAAVAWEMWSGGDYLVPHLNGAAYSHKPPLLFWLIGAGWQLVGPSALWLRLVGPLACALDLWLVHHLARRLWPHLPQTALLAPLILIGSLVWTVYGTLLLFDTLLTACVLIAILGIVDLRDGHRRGVTLLAVGVWLGVLAKGPVVLLHVLPVAMLAGWWDAPAASGAGETAVAPPPVGPWPDGQRPLRGGRWAAWVAAGVLGGAGLALLWAVPAALAGGPAYGREIFLGQTTGRLVRSFAHRRPLWWYLPQLAWMLIPWWPWPAVWRGLRRLRAGVPDRGARLCVTWGLPALAAFSLVSGKQVHYLLPELPAVALLVARALVAAAEAPAREITRRSSAAMLWPALVLAIPGTALLLAKSLSARLLATLPAAVQPPPFWMALLLAIVPPVAALAGAWPTGRPGAAGGGERPDAAGVPAAGGVPPAIARPVARVTALSAATVALVVLVHAAALPTLASSYDLTPISRRLGDLERAGVPLAQVGSPYAGQFTFLGRLRRPVDEISRSEAVGWLESHPGGRLITYTLDPASPPDGAEFAQRYRGGWVAIQGHLGDIARAPPR